MEWHDVRVQVQTNFNVEEGDTDPIATRLRNRTDETRDDHNEPNVDVEPTLSIRTRSSGAVNIDSSLDRQGRRKRSETFEDTEIEMPSMYCPLHGNIIPHSEAVMREMNDTTLAPCFCKHEKIATVSWDEAVAAVASQIDVSEPTLKYWVRKNDIG
jgi:hypothetical protein